jgi:hypothetical protein
MTRYWNTVYPLKAGRWHPVPTVTADRVSSHNAATSGCHVWPFWVPDGYTYGVTKIGVYSCGSSGDAGATDMTIQVGLYDSTASDGYYPDSLLHDTGSMTVNTTGIQTDGAFSEVTLAAGTIYWLAAKKNNTPSNASASTAGLHTAGNTIRQPYQTLDTGITIDSRIQMLKGTQAGAFPDPFAAGFTPNTAAIQAPVPWFYLNTLGTA